MRGEEYNMPTDIQFKDEYDKLKKKLERDLKRVRESLQD